jgi:hypothetical protein
MMIVHEVKGKRMKIISFTNSYNKFWTELTNFGIKSRVLLNTKTN